MLSYHNDPAIKAKFQLRFAAHRAADEVIQGTGFDNGRGCFVGCTLDNYSHSQFPVQLGWPEWLARLADAIFEGLPEAEAPQFGTDLLEAVPVGVDLEKVQYMIAMRRHQRGLARLQGNKEPYAEQCRLALQKVIDYCIEMSGPAYGSWSAQSAAAQSAAALSVRAAAAAWSAQSAAALSVRAAAAAARSAALSAAWSALSAWSARSAQSAAALSARSARSAAWSAARSARSAAESAARSARSAAESEMQLQRGDLLSILRTLAPSQS